MRINFRNTIMAPAVLAVASFVAVSAHAETTVKVPFAFKAEGKVCPAGDYVVSRDLNRNMLTLRSKQTGRSFMWVAGAGNAGAKDVALFFDSNGSSRQLRSVQDGVMSTSQLDKNKHNEHVPVETITGQ